jgi:hypothetical protein
MTLRTNLRGLRALTLIVACAGLALSPAVGTAAAKSKSKKTSKTVKAKRQAVTVDDGLGNRLGLGATTQLAAMKTGLNAAPQFFAGRSTGCASLTAMLAAQPGSIMAGNFRDATGACYVWLNLKQSSLLTGSEICKIAMHEYGHLTGLEHSADVNDIMFAPFQADPIPAPCQPRPTGV